MHAFSRNCRSSGGTPLRRQTIENSVTSSSTLRTRNLCDKATDRGPLVPYSRLILGTTGATTSDRRWFDFVETFPRSPDCKDRRPPFRLFFSFQSARAKPVSTQRGHATPLLSEREVFARIRVNLVVVPDTFPS